MATHILYIEDDNLIRENVADLLTLYGYEVETSPNGQEGVGQAMRFPPDLILCDIMMPQMDGYGVLDAVRNIRSLATVPFIFLTAKSEEMDIRQGMISGADDYLRKPFTMENLLQAIESRLQREAMRKADWQNRLEEHRRSIANLSSHEYNTQLNGIIGLSQVLKEQHRELDEEETLSMIALIQVCGLRLKRSLDNLRLMEELQQVDPLHSSYGFFSSGTALLDREMVDQYLRKVNERQDKEVTGRIAVEGAQIRLSEANLGIILDELIDNAHKFSDGSEPIGIIGHLEGLDYHLTISNHGQIFKPEDIVRIAPYVQFDRKRFEQQGSGLGLAIVKKVLALNNGTLEITSLPAGETSVMVTFQK